MKSYTNQPKYHALLRHLFCVSFCSIVSLPSALLAHDHIAGKQDIALAEQQMLALFYETSSLPTKTLQAFDKLPIVMTVITAEQIRQMGARDMRMYYD